MFAVITDVFICIQHDILFWSSTSISNNTTRVDRSVSLSSVIEVPVETKESMVSHTCMQAHTTQTYNENDGGT